MPRKKKAEEPEILIGTDNDLMIVLDVLLADDEPSADAIYNAFCCGVRRMTPVSGLHPTIMIAWFCGLFQKLAAKA